MSEDEREQEQLLHYARDLSRAHAAERERTRELEEALRKLEEVNRELARANAELAAQRDELEKRVQHRERELEQARKQLGTLSRTDGAVSFHGLISGEPAMLRIFETARQVAKSDVSVLIRGESGSGKELVARSIHAESPRRGQPFVALNCATVTPTLAESLLFGHVKGAFTGAVTSHVGVFREAHGGTLFLDEVAELPLEIQAKLLRVVQERVVTPVGGTGTIPVDVRVIAASHRSLPDEVRAGRFREDLMYRLRVVPLELPPLRERPGDLPRLIRHFFVRLNQQREEPVESLSPAAVRALLAHRWPGNVRELENVLLYAFAVVDGPRIELAHLPPDLLANDEASALAKEKAAAGEGHPARTALSDEDEAEAIRSALERTEGRIEDAARLLRMSRATFHRKRKKHGLV